jgi:ribose transport system substrate-binding protein/inositol transport system substrate-binding protein
MPHLKTPFMTDMSNAVKKYAKAAGLNVVQYVADNNPAKQISQIREAIDIGVSGIVMDPASNEEVEEGVRTAKAAGIPLVTLHETVSNQDECVSFVGPDFTDGGVKEMKQAMADLPKGGRIAVIYGVIGHSAQIDISAGYPIALRGREDDYRVVFRGEGKWSSEDALKCVSEYLSSGKSVDAIICNNDAMAIGALQAVTAAGKAGKIKIYGLDAQDDVLAAIKEGTIGATIFTDYETEAKMSIDIIVKAMRGEPVNSRYMIPMTLINSRNVDQFIRR